MITQEIIQNFEPIYIFSIAPAIIAGGLALASSLGTNLFNKAQQDEANELTKQNNEFNQQEYLDEKRYKRELQERMFQREDTSYQRTVDDIQKSGLSALAINGTNGAGNIVSQSQMPELNSITPFQAQNMDFGQLADIIGQADERQLEKDKFEYQKEKDQTDLEFSKSQAKEQTRQFEVSTRQTQQQIAQQALKIAQDNKLQKSEQVKRFEEIDANIKHLEAISKLENSKAKQEAEIKAIKELTNGKGKLDKCSSKKEYESKMQIFQAKKLKKAQEIENYIKTEYSSKSEGKSKSYSGGAGVKGIANAEAGYSTNSNEAWSKELIQTVNSMWDTFYTENDYPVLWDN